MSAAEPGAFKAAERSADRTATRRSGGELAPDQEVMQICVGLQIVD